MPIQLDGWEVVIPDQVYSNPTFIDGNMHNGVKGYLLLTKYREPTETEVLDYMQKAAKGVSSIALPHGVTLKGVSKIATYMGSNLPKQLIGDLKNGDLECAKFVRNFIPAKNMPVEEAIKWLVARYGLLPDDLVQKYAESKTEMDFYEQTFANDELQKHGLGQNFQLKLRMPLVDKAEANVLAKHGVMTSDSLDTDRRYEMVEATTLLDALYSIASFDYVKDTTDEMLDLHAGKTVGRIKEHFVKQAIAQKAMSDPAKLKQLKDTLTERN